MFGRERKVKRARKKMRQAVATVRLVKGRQCVRCRQRGETKPAYGIERPTGLRQCDACWEDEPADLKKMMTECHSVHRCPDEVRKGHPGGGPTYLWEARDILVRVHKPECPYYQR